MGKSKKFPCRHLSLAVFAVLSQYAWANTQNDEVTTDLGSMTVTVETVPKEEVGEEIVTRQELTQNMVQDVRDLVRYNAEVDVAEVGRYGSKGFAIRGVDGNRVAMSVDGVALPEVESNEIYSPYGYNYEGRFSPDLEMVGRVRIATGADSLISGSGAVGGSVSYSTKEPRDLLQRGNPVGGYVKVGYTDKNEELLTAAGIAAEYGKFEFLLNYARRQGHELKNHDMRAHNSARMDVNYKFWENDEEGYKGRNTSALYPDAADYTRDAVLAKAYYQLNDHHRFGLQFNHQKQETESFAYSKGLSGRRFAVDTEKMSGFGFNYEFTPNSDWLERLRAEYNHQDVEGIADTGFHLLNFATDTYYKSVVEYRPTQTKTDQIRLNAQFVPIDWGKFGSHYFGLTASYAKQDHTASKPFANLDSTTGDVTSAGQNGVIPYPDAKKDIFSIVLSDHIEFNDRFKAMLGLRYDSYRYSPYFQDDTWFGRPETSETYVLTKNINSPTKFYQDYRNGVYDRSTSFDKFTYGAGFDYQLIPDRLTMRYKVGTGFLAPTVTQMYSAFEGMSVQQLINTDLKPETSVNQELEFEFNYNPLTLKASWYHSRYKNFIHTVYWDRWDKRALSSALGCQQSTCVQSQNADEAEISGVKLGLKLDVSEWLNMDNRLVFTADYHKSRDEARVMTDYDGVLTVNTLAAAPASTILGLDYHFLNDRASLHFRGKFTEAKRPEDTKYVVAVGDWNRSAGYREEVGVYRHVERGKDTWTFDLFGSYTLADRLTLQAGIYNLFDSKYIPWENLRQFGNNPSINNFVDCSSNPRRACDGYGFNRYTAPGRNYALSLTYEW